MTNVFTPKSAKKFFCKECDFECSKRSDWSRHISTQKHKIRTNTNYFTPKNAEQYHCNFGKMLFGKAGVDKLFSSFVILFFNSLFEIQFNQAIFKIFFIAHKIFENPE